MKTYKPMLAMMAILLSMVFVVGCTAVPDVKAQDIQSIQLVEFPREDIIHICTQDEIQGFADAYNVVRRYRNDVGTTPEIIITISFSDKTAMTVWALSSGASAVERNGRQFNIRGTALDDWLTGILTAH